MKSSVFNDDEHHVPEFLHRVASGIAQVDAVCDRPDLLCDVRYRRPRADAQHGPSRKFGRVVLLDGVHDPPLEVLIKTGGGGAGGEGILSVVDADGVERSLFASSFIVLPLVVIL